MTDKTWTDLSVTSSAVSNGTTQTTGPNISSVISLDVSFTLAITVGRM